MEKSWKRDRNAKKRFQISMDYISRDILGLPDYRHYHYVPDYRPLFNTRLFARFQIRFHADFVRIISFDPGFFLRYCPWGGGGGVHKGPFGYDRRDQKMVGYADIVSTFIIE